MKKILLFGLSLVGLSAAAQVQRMVLVEEFTNASCGPCAAQNPAFNTLLANNMNKVVQIKYQTYFPGTDPMNAQNPTEVENRRNRYKISGVPAMVGDGDTSFVPQTAQVYQGAPAGLTQAAINNAYAIPSPFTLNVTYNYNSSTDSITSVVTLTNSTPNPINASAASNLKLLVSIVEMNIDYATAPGSNGETEFYYVMRKMLPDTNGTALPNTINAGQSLSFTFKAKAPSYIYKKNEMCIAAFIQDFGTNDVHQAAIAYPPNTVDAALVSATTVASTSFCGATINPAFTLTNKGTTPITSGSYGYTVNGAPGVTQNWNGNLATGASSTLSLPAITAPNGVTTYDFFFNNINAGAVDIIGANNEIAPTITRVLGSITSDINETFEANAMFDPNTAQSINNPSNLPAYVVTKAINSGLTTDIGGYAASAKSYRFNMYNIQQGTPSLIFYKNNINGKNFTGVVWDYAYNHYTGTDGTFYDTMSVAASIDCGATFTEIWRKGYEDLRTTITAPAAGANFYPTATEWKTGSAFLPTNMLNANELVIKFSGHSGWGNNAYIDNVVLSGAVNVNEFEKDLSLSIYPNPVSTEINVKANVNVNEPTTITLVDVMGRVVYTKTQSASVINESINAEMLANGIYQVRLVNGNGVATKSISVQH